MVGVWRRTAALSVAVSIESEGVAVRVRWLGFGGWGLAIRVWRGALSCGVSIPFCVALLRIRV